MENRIDELRGCLRTSTQKLKALETSLSCITPDHNISGHLIDSLQQTLTALQGPMDALSQTLPETGAFIDPSFLPLEFY